MPRPTIEQLVKKATSIRKLVAAEGESGDQAKRRSLRKRLRRVQRRRRKTVVAAQRASAKTTAAGAAPEAPKAE